MKTETSPATPLHDVVTRSFRDVAFEQAMFEWYQQRGGELLKEPNHPEFQVRYDEHSKVFAAILGIKFCMLSEERKSQVAEAIARSFSED